MRQLLKTVFCTRYQVSFYLWWMEPVVNPCKVLKYCAHDCLKIFPLLFKSFIMSQITKNWLFFDSGKSSKSHSQWKSKAFLYQFLTLTKHGKSCFNKTCNFGTFMQFGSFIFVAKASETTENYEWYISKYRGLKGAGASYNKQFMSTDNRALNISA